MARVAGILSVEYLFVLGEDICYLSNTCCLYFEEVLVEAYGPLLNRFGHIFPLLCGQGKMYPMEITYI